MVYYLTSIQEILKEVFKELIVQVLFKTHYYITITYSNYSFCKFIDYNRILHKENYIYNVFVIGKVLNNIDTTSSISPKIITEFYRNINLKNTPLLTESNSFTIVLFSDA